jgi:two-component system CheB/CheR fusion protein
MPARAIRKAGAARVHASHAGAPTPPASSAALAAQFMVAGIGASAGGLEACLDLLDAMPLNNGIAFVLIQHLDPTHKSMLVDLLATHTAMPVLEACDGMQIETDHVYVIAPGTDLSVKDGMLLQATIRTSHGVRLPFDLFLQSLATEYGARAACVILPASHP